MLTHIQQPHLDTMNVHDNIGGRLSRRFRPQGEAASMGHPPSIPSMEQAPSHERWQDTADVSISGSEAGPSGRHALPDEDPSLYTHRSNRSHLWVVVLIIISCWLQA